MSTRGELFDPLFGADRVGAELSDEAWVRAMLDVEVALGRAQATIGLLSAEQCAAIETSVAELGAPGGVDIAELGRAAVNGGNPVIPLVKILRERATPLGVEPELVHQGATSQDILDNALLLILRRGGSIVVDDLHSAADAAADLARIHRETPMVARTLGQQALPSTFGLLATTWFTSLDRAATRLGAALSAAPVQFGGAAGTLAASHPHGLRVSDALADDLGLSRAVAPWHTDRTPILEIATALGVAAAAVSKPATDIVAMSSTEVAEVAEQNPGGSSAMPHKRNPTAAVTARASARRAPGLVATVLANSDHEFNRAGGPWHAEWETLTGLLRCTGGAASRLATSLQGLEVDSDAMARNLQLTGGHILAERVTAALAHLTSEARGIVTRAARSGSRLSESPEITRHLDTARIVELTDPTNYLGHATDLVDRALAARRGEMS
ncbi:3-carboxy-cis,cis-muconate cycloisomerase [Gordonia namibiensis NBRC 108229]|uniref:3-carboxy-cis,cis-muconate cycloisomerase n=1 Tax=Gordonia namibiensis NBRC 108229 TaxID=1208314 RepID=K6VXE0_9ACTN|nr:lyase family protein [Gordonia namibiensis]GAC00894.1 3-carboxy-cis,cis-muconate cycloisomerase [Gordonia namibiensis NBRC 108229]